MAIWFENITNPDNEQDFYDSNDEQFDLSQSNGDLTRVSKKTDESIVIKNINLKTLKNILYSNIITFIKDYIGDSDDLQLVIKTQHDIHDMFVQLADEVSDKYNANKGKLKDSTNIKDDYTKRKIITMYKFYASYIVKYDRKIVQWMEDLIKKNLFNDKSNITDINGAYDNIDISNILSLQTHQLTPEYFTLLDNSTKFNKTMGDMFMDSGYVFENLAKASGVFTSMNQMLLMYRRGIIEEIRYQNKDGDKVPKRILIPVGDSEEALKIYELMNLINSTISKIITVDAIRNKFILDYKRKLDSINVTQQEVNRNLEELTKSIKNGDVKSLEDFDKITSKFKRISTSSKDKEKLAEKTAKMASAYKYKIEAILNKDRSKHV